MFKAYFDIRIPVVLSPNCIKSNNITKSAGKKQNLQSRRVAGPLEEEFYSILL